MGQNITREEAAERAAAIEVGSYLIEVDLRNVTADPTFLSTTTVRFSGREPGSRTWIDLIADEVVDVEFNGASLDVRGYDGARLPLPDLCADNELVVRARCRYMTSGEGLHRSLDPADGRTYLYTQFAMADARRVFACFEQPDLKASHAWRVIAPAGWEVRTNTPGGGPELLGEGSARWVFPPTQPLSTYLAALCAGPFHVVGSQYVGDHGTYPLALLVRQSVAEHLDTDEVFELTRAGLAHYEAMFDISYPFGKYDQVALPEFNLGAMEHPGLVTFQEDVLVFRSRQTDGAREKRAMMLLHEMAHMWFGNLVTMRWWDDLWLNESFAEWAGFSTAAQATRFTSAWTAFAQSRKAWAYRQDQQPSTHPVAADIVDLQDVYLNIDGITYAKGAAVVKALVAFVGVEAFLSGLNRYLAAFAWGNATLADLLGAVEVASGRDLGSWAQAWLRTPGVTTLQPKSQTDADGRYTRVVIEQLPANRPEGVPDLMRPQRVALGLYRWVGDGASASLVRDRRVEIDVLGSLAEVSELVGVPAADLLLANDDDLTYAKVRFDPESLRTALGSVGALAESLPRSLVWCALWEMVRDGLLPGQRFISAVLAGLAAEDRPLTVEMVLGQARTATTAYLADELRAEQAMRLCAGTADLLVHAEPGSDRQLALARAHAACAVDPGRLDRMVDLLAGRVSLPGLTVDDDLRWAIVIRLAERGVAGEELIDETLANDRTSSGERSAAQARAARPTRAAKAAAWAAAVGTDPLPNAILAATVAGFSSPDTPKALLAPYRARYVDQIQGLWQDRPPAQARTLARGLFPGVDEQTLRAADELLARDHLPEGLRRIVAEGRADVALALACREVSGVAG